ncbi:MAG: fluoride efflux transporter CrcB [Acidobacteriota bacterium]
MREILWIALGGSLGALCRFFLTGWVQRSVVSGFPWGTTVVNLLGCLAIGGLVGWSSLRGDFSDSARLFALIGFLGSFTTFSTFALETLALMRAGSLAPGLSNLLLQTGGGLLAVIVGDRLGRWLG